MDTIRFGLGVRALRRRRGWRQIDLARAAQVSRGPIVRIERGRADRVTVATLDRISAALGARVQVRLQFQGEELDRLLDAEHARLVERIVRALSLSGWNCATEVSFNVYGERGSIDVLAYHTASRIALVVEAKSVIPDVGGMLATLDRKTRLGVGIARERGWPAVAVGRLLVAAESRTTRKRLAAFSRTFESTFRDRGWAARRWLRAPSEVVGGWSGLWILSAESGVATRARVRVREPTAVHADAAARRSMTG